MHIHAGFGDADSRIRVMTAMRRYLPLLHAISTSSPFNSGRETGYKSYRLTIMGALPRTGLPGPLWSRAEFDQLVAEYQRMKLIGDGSELWWDIRPSVRFPTIELRICDLCPRVDDAMCIAALYASLIRRLSRLDREGELPAEPPTEIIAENRWLAQRYGVLGFHGDTRAGGRKDIEDSTAELVEELAADADALGCERELQHALAIIRGESPLVAFRAHHALTLRELARRAGISPSYLSEIERGLKPGSASALAKVATALDTTVDTLQTDSDTR